MATMMVLRSMARPVSGLTEAPGHGRASVCAAGGRGSGAGRRIGLVGRRSYPEVPDPMSTRPADTRARAGSPPGRWRRSPAPPRPEGGARAGPSRDLPHPVEDRRAASLGAAAGPLRRSGGPQAGRSDPRHPVHRRRSHRGRTQRDRRGGSRWRAGGSSTGQAARAARTACRRRSTLAPRLVSATTRTTPRGRRESVADTALRVKIWRREEGFRDGGGSGGCGPVHIEDSFVKISIPPGCPGNPHSDGVQGFDGPPLTVDNVTIDFRDADCGTAPSSSRPSRATPPRTSTTCW